jgi:glucosyl-dolichyl phosphate glucuronosyltransferase
MAMQFSVVIATYNRSAILAHTLDSLSGLVPNAPWEVIVVDNNSTDDTRAVVTRAAASYPCPLRYAFEREQGRSAALNCAFGLSTGDVIVTTDDDVRVEPDWLTRIQAAFERVGCDYIGGRVVPIWEEQPPEWFPRSPGLLWGVIALLDYGSQPARFDQRVPLGVNMAMRRSAIDRAGGFNNRVGRKAGTLLGQEVREWCQRAHALGLTGWYVPEVVVEHLIPRDRLKKAYFRRWFYWRGVSRAILYAETGLDMESLQPSPVDSVPHIAGVPRYLFRSAAKAFKQSVHSALKGDQVAAFERELWLCFFAGIVHQRWKDRRLPLARKQMAARHPPFTPPQAG